MVVSWSCAVSCEVEGRMRFGDTTLPLQNNIKILGVNMDVELYFDLHLQILTRQVSFQVFALSRVAVFFDRQELSCCTSVATHLKKLDKVERQAMRLVDGTTLNLG
ncbi:hypothetical protein E2C01_054268 [Portunus trituberculatus]|uniref:Uncharacterized protein n=1 Tax=Portunus trituberculatus TaxID=210409 RepID=A0A5B7GTA2_PORTR|nr:hypothetical protein [Portunus trituberculatus]